MFVSDPDIWTGSPVREGRKVTKPWGDGNCCGRCGLIAPISCCVANPIHELLLCDDPALLSNTQTSEAAEWDHFFYCQKTVSRYGDELSSPSVNYISR